jgi:hypothetical protein
MKYYMLVLSGNGDTEIKFVNKETWDWVADTTGEVKLPESQSDAISKSITEFYTSRYLDIPQDKITNYISNVENMHNDNDKALDAKPDIGETFCTLKEAMVFIKENNLEIVDEYAGCVY